MTQKIDGFPMSGACRGVRYYLDAARYVKGKVALRTERIGPEIDIYKHEAHWLAEALGARYSRRSGYLLAPTRAKQWRVLFRAGFEASRRYFGRDKTPCVFGRDDDEKVCGLAGLTLGQAMKAVRKLNL